MGGLDLDLTVGEPLTVEGKKALADVLADSLVEFVSVPREEYSDLTEEISIAHTDFTLDDVAAITFSGGCSEFIYGEEDTDFGDLGPYLGPAIMEHAEATGIPIERTRRGIRATVVGSTQYSVQISGNTIHTSDDEQLPVRNRQVLSVEMDVDSTFEEVYPKVEQALERFDLDDLDQDFALCFAVDGRVPTIDTMRTIADAVSTAWEEYDRAGPVVAILDLDLAQSVGSHLEKRLDERDVVVVDGIDVGSLEYVDIGGSLESSGAVPVIVKSLVFGARHE
jgi:ethanolamine utilization protein EutA